MDWRQPPGAAQRGSLVFAGGRADFIEKYLEPLGHWHSRGWNVTSFDWRGQGHSRGTIVGGNFRDFDPLARDAGELIESVIAQTPGPHVAVAHSMGGHLLLRVLAERRPSLAAAVLVAPMLAVNSSPLPRRVGSLVARWLARLSPERPVWRERAGLSGDGKIRQVNLTRCPDRFSDEHWWKEREPGFHLGPPSWGWLDAAFRSTARHEEEALRSVHVPVLLLGTDRDRLVNPRAIRRAARLLPQSELLMFKDAAHELLREIDEVRLEALARIDRFFDAHAPA
nr:alpha/beta hydrolase [uncultured Sphingosinicella sp.]